MGWLNSRIAAEGEEASTDAPGVLLVKGKAGAGKSAVIQSVVTLARGGADIWSDELDSQVGSSGHAMGRGDGSADELKLQPGGLRPIILEVTGGGSTTNKRSGSRGVRLHTNNSGLHDLLHYGRYVQPLLTHDSNDSDYVPPLNNKVGERRMTKEEKGEVMYDVPHFGADLCEQLYEHHRGELEGIPIEDTKLLEYYNKDVQRDSLFGDDEDDAEFYSPQSNEITNLNEINNLADLVNYGRLRNKWSTDHSHSCRCFLDVLDILYVARNARMRNMTSETDCEHTTQGDNP